MDARTAEALNREFGTFTVDDDYTPGSRRLPAADVAEIMSNAYRTGLLVDLRHDDAGYYMAVHDGMGIGYGHYRFQRP